MSRGLVRFCAIFAFIALSTGAQTVDEVIAKNIQAEGGLAKLDSVQTLRTSGKMIIQSFEARFVEAAKRSDKVREEMTIQGMSQVRAYDGKTAWQIDPFEGRRDPELLSADDSKDLQIDADIDGPLVNYKEKGYKAEFVGHDSVEGTDCYKIKLTLKNGDIRYYYLDTDSFLELKLETQTSIRGSIQENETFYGDYEEVNGIYYPFAFETGQKGGTDRVKFTVEKVEQNVPLDDSLFSMPAVKKAPGAN
ncbi:MAG TPA: outer membrane lipoprotein-sorting protein [Candidatus Acidoferrales bacterium]|nr:outer membrane lipoprotein-sorting protein [Candidatus Acidoferrales bacterium]